MQQEVSFDEDGVPTNIITYDQEITYEKGSKEPVVCTADPEAPPVTVDKVKPEELVAIPFENLDANTDLALELRDNIDAFESVEYPLPLPEVPREVDNRFVTGFVLAGLVIFGLAFCMGMSFTAIMAFSPKQPPAAPVEALQCSDGLPECS